jgi:hypothetical protein
MPYIDKIEVAEIRKELKKSLPNFKFSVVRQHYTCVNIHIVSGPLQMTNKEYEQVNHFYIADHYTGQTKKVLLKVYEIASKKQHEQQYDIDYGSIPNYYINISIGQWDKPFINTNK